MVENLEQTILENEGDRDDILTDVKEFVSNDIQKQLWIIAKRIVERQKKCLKTPIDHYKNIQWEVLEDEWHSFMSEELLKNYSKDYE